MHTIEYYLAIKNITTWMNPEKYAKYKKLVRKDHILYGSVI